MTIAKAGLTHPVIALEQQRCNAIVRADWQQLHALLAPQLVYVHAPGIVHDRDQLLQFLRQELSFSLVERRGLALQGATDDVAWTTGLLHLKGCKRSSGEPIAATSFVSQVWTQSESGWHLALFQSTGLPNSSG